MPGVAIVTIPPNSTDLTTLTAARAMVDASTSQDDYHLAALIDRASAIIAAYIGQPLGLRTVQETFRLSWTTAGPSTQNVMPYGTPLDSTIQPLLLQFYPVPSILSVTENTVTLDPSADYEADAGSLYRLRNGLRSWWAVPTIVVTYQTGWSLPNDLSRNLPHDIEDACLSLVQSGFYNRASNPSVIMELAEGVGRVQYNRNASAAAMTIDAGMEMRLQPYVNRVW